MANDEWGTPPAIFNPLNDEFKFAVDLAASDENAKLPNAGPFTYVTEKEDTLSKDWVELLEGGWGWLNPPFSRGNIDKFMAKVRAENLRGAKIVTLTKLDSTEWFTSNVFGTAKEVRMIIPRVTFVGATDSYPWPCAITIFDGKKHKRPIFKYWRWR
jgi:phage N-6-adenine-methyltransferase